MGRHTRTAREISEDVAQTFQQMAYGNALPAEVERDALLVEKQAMRAQWQWMARHWPAEYGQRKMELAVDIQRVAKALRLFTFTSPTDEVPERASGADWQRLLRVEEDLVRFYQGCMGTRDEIARAFDDLDLGTIYRAVREAKELKRPWLQPEDFEAEEGEAAARSPEES